MSVQLQNYKNNPKLKRVGQDIPFERTQIEEYIKCKNDVIYFLNNYFQIVTIDKGKQIIKLWDYQEDIINLVHQNRNTIVLSARQISKTTTVCGYILHYILDYETSFDTFKRKIFYSAKYFTNHEYSINQSINHFSFPVPSISSKQWSQYIINSTIA